MNQHLLGIPHYMAQFDGPVEGWDDLYISHLLNDTPVSAKVWANRDKSRYFFPREAMAELVNGLTS